MEEVVMAVVVMAVVVMAVIEAEPALLWEYPSATA
jgi:hypothetical protein